MALSPAAGALDPQLEGRRASVRAVPSVPSPGSLERLVLTLAILALFLLSPDLLNDIGIDYDTPAGGSLIWRFHPATYLILAVLALAAFRRGNPVRFVDLIIGSRLVSAALVLFVFVVIWSAAILHVPFTPPLETFVIPTLLFLLLTEHGEAMKRRLALIAHVVLALNASIALVEYATRVHLIGPPILELPFRSTALLGHPLENAAVTGAYVLACACGGMQDMAKRLRAPALVLQLLALIAFGGRTGLVVTYAMLPLTAVPGVLRAIRRRSIGRTQIIMGMIAVFILGSLFLVSADLGLFTTQLERFSNDNGSAHTREVLPTIVSHFSLSDLVFGPDQDRLHDYQYLEATPIAIESFWFGSLLLYGILCVVPLWIGCAFLSAALCSVSRAGSVLVMIQFWIVASGSNSISAKGLTLIFIEVFLVCALRRPKDGARAAR